MLRELGTETTPPWVQFCEWRAYDELDPIGDEREDIRSAHQVQTLVNLHRGENVPPHKLTEFVLPFGDYQPPPKPQQSWQDMKALAMQWANVVNTVPEASGSNTLS